MRLYLLRSLLASIAMLTAAEGWAYPAYKDGSWGVVSQDGGRTCIVVANNEDKSHAFHVLIDGMKNTATIGILDRFLPDLQDNVASTVITLNFGPGFMRRLEFKRHFDGSLDYLAAELPLDDLDSMLIALRSRITGGVILSFENGETWRMPPPKSNEAATIIERCWNEALRGTHTRLDVHFRYSEVRSTSLPDRPLNG